MYKNSKFALLDTKSNETSEQTINEFHYKGGIGIATINGGENKVIPFSLAYSSKPNQTRGVHDNSEPKVVPEDLFNKLFFSVADEVNEKGKRKTMKKLN
jgi:hypothetical protein